MVKIILIALFSFLIGYLHGRAELHSEYEKKFKQFTENVKDIYKK